MSTICHSPHTLLSLIEILTNNYLNRELREEETTRRALEVDMADSDEEEIPPPPPEPEPEPEPEPPEEPVPPGGRQPESGRTSNGASAQPGERVSQAPGPIQPAGTAGTRQQPTRSSKGGPSAALMVGKLQAANMRNAARAQAGTRRK